MGTKADVYKAIELLLSSATDEFVCISKAEYQSAIKNGIDKGGRLKVIENGINVKAVEDAVPMVRQEIGIPEDSFVIGMVGRLTSQKAPDTFVKAAKLISEQIPKTFFLIVGNGEEEEDVKRYAWENGINLMVTGWTDKPYSYLKVFDIAVLLSRWEGFGLAIAEYMAAEKNLVATKVDAIPTIVDDGVDGILVDVDSPKEVADAVYYYYTHPNEAKKMRQKAKKKVSTRYDISRVVIQHKQMFEELMNR